MAENRSINFVNLTYDDSTDGHVSHPKLTVITISQFILLHFICLLRRSLSCTPFHAMLLAQMPIRLTLSTFTLFNRHIYYLYKRD